MSKTYWLLLNQPVPEKYRQIDIILKRTSVIEDMPDGQRDYIELEAAKARENLRTMQEECRKLHAEFQARRRPQH